MFYLDRLKNYITKRCISYLIIYLLFASGSYLAVVSYNEPVNFTHFTENAVLYSFFKCTIIVYLIFINNFTVFKVMLNSALIVLMGGNLGSYLVFKLSTSSVINYLYLIMPVILYLISIMILFDDTYNINFKIYRGKASGNNGTITRFAIGLSFLFLSDIMKFIMIP